MSYWYSNLDVVLHFVLQYVSIDIFNLFLTSLFLLKLIGLLWTFHVSMGNLPHVSASIVLRNAVAHNLLHRDLCSISYDCPQQQKLKASCHVDSRQHGMTESSAENFANPFIENFRDGSKKVQICLVGIWRDIFPATVFQTVLNGPKQRFDEVEDLWECNSVDIT